MKTFVVLMKIKQKTSTQFGSFCFATLLFKRLIIYITLSNLREKQVLGINNDGKTQTQAYTYWPRQTHTVHSVCTHCPQHPVLSRINTSLDLRLGAAAYLSTYALSSSSLAPAIL